MSLIAELQRRSVFKVGAAYLVVAWLVVQAASIAFPAFDAPAWVLRVFILMLLLGFPVALVLAWALEVTPQGIRVDAPSAGSKRLYVVATVLAVLALAWFYRGQPSYREGDPQADQGTPSIAVLPFVNMSGSAENEYFSDGISEEILNQLAKQRELKVAARTSSFSYKGEKREVRDIARELGVRLVLEGSVRRQGERVRITAQLIDAEQGFHLWSETYDRDLKDIFAIQDEIARAIAKQLRLELATAPDGSSDAAAGTEAGVDVEAYDLYLRAIGLLPRRDYRELAQAVELLERSVAKAPSFARGQATLAIALNLQALYAPDVPVQEMRERALDAAQRAIALDPALAEAYGALGLVATNTGRDATALLLLDRAIALNPSFAQAHTWRALSLRGAGRWDESERESRIALDLDPRSHNIYTNLVWHLAAAGRLDEARAMVERKRAIDPGSASTRLELALLDLIEGRHAEAHALLLGTIRDEPAARRLVDDLLAALEGRKPKGPVVAAVAARAAAIFRPETNPYSVVNAAPIMLLALGARDEALAAVERFAAAVDADANLRLRGVLRIALVSAAVGDLRCEPRFQAAIAEVGAVDGLARSMCAR
jgi:TolB-like protein/Flp pilus assembly protein TadD